MHVFFKNYRFIRLDPVLTIDQRKWLYIADSLEVVRVKSSRIFRQTRRVLLLATEIN